MCLRPFGLNEFLGIVCVVFFEVLKYCFAALFILLYSALCIIFSRIMCEEFEIPLRQQGVYNKVTRSQTHCQAWSNQRTSWPTWPLVWRRPWHVYLYPTVRTTTAPTRHSLPVLSEGNVDHGFTKTTIYCLPDEFRIWHYLEIGDEEGDSGQERPW